MSKLCNIIEFKQTGRVKLVENSNVIDVIEEISSPMHSANLFAVREYRIGVTMMVKGFVNDDVKTIGTELTHLKNMCKRQIIQEVFGEFRPLLRAVERHLYERDFDAARTALQHLENEMLS